jgi:hypothetical protein
VREIPILITYDVHVHASFSAPEIERFLQHTLVEHDRVGVKASFLFPAEAARSMESTVRAVLKQGHQVGCHGLTHRDESYDSLPQPAQEDMLRRATSELEDITQQRVAFFRAPVFKISGMTIRILEELGYEADLSINSQRLGLFSSDVWNVSWLVAPRRPYHPDIRVPWRRGKSKLWEIPLSCLGLPFMVNTGQVFGLPFMKAFFSGLYLESRYWGKPIVYMAHPEDLYPWREPSKPRSFRWRDLIPTRDHGFPFKYSLYRMDPIEVTNLCRRLMEYMRSFPGVKFLTVPEYVARLNHDAIVRRSN